MFHHVSSLINTGVKFLNLLYSTSPARLIYLGTGKQMGCNREQDPAGDPGRTLAAEGTTSYPDLPLLTAVSRRRRAKPTRYRGRRGTPFLPSHGATVLRGALPRRRVVAVGSWRRELVARGVACVAVGTDG